MTKLFATVRRLDIGRIERFHWSARITWILASQASRVRFVGSEELLIATLFLWFATLHVVAALRGAAASADRVQEQAYAVGALSRPILPPGGTRAEPRRHAAGAMICPGFCSTTPGRQAECQRGR
jgi:hypothetical protein